MAEMVPFSYNNASTTISVSNSGASGVVVTALPTSTPTSGPNPADTCIVQNTGTKECFIAFGTTSANTTAAAIGTNTVGFPIQPTLAVNYHFNISGQGFIAAICAGTDTTTLRVSVGHGRL